MINPRPVETGPCRTTFVSRLMGERKGTPIAKQKTRRYRTARPVRQHLAAFNSNSDLGEDLVDLSGHIIDGSHAINALEHALGVIVAQQSP